MEKKLVAKVNKEIGGWDYRGYHITHDTKIKTYLVKAFGEEVSAGKTLGEAKKYIDDLEAELGLDEIDYKLEMKVEAQAVIEEEEKVEQEQEQEAGVIETEFTSKRGTKYLIRIKDGKIIPYTNEVVDGKTVTRYWSLTNEIKKAFE